MICIPNTPEIDELRRQYNKKYKDNMTEHQFIALLEAMMSRYSAKSIPDNLSAINKYYKEQRQKDAEMERLMKQPKYYEQGFSPAQSPTERQALYAQEQNKEMEEIKQRAIADGTFMKAPNGKKSNLNERQWLQVRTEAFKKWFGDWYNNGVTVRENKEAGYEGSYDIIVEGTTIGVINIGPGLNEVDWVDINREDRNKGYGIATYIALNRVLTAKGSVLRSRPSEHNPLHVNAKRVWESLIKRGLAVETEDGYDMLPDTSVSKVVDENGEPLVVHHYTDNEALSEFSTEFDNYFAQSGGTKNAIFFTEDNVEPGTEDNFLTNRKKKLDVFLNIRDLEQHHGTKEDLHKRGTTYREVVNKSAEKPGRANGLRFSGFDDNKKIDQTIWVIHSSNQVKSATDNIGTFSTEEDNIFYSLVPEEARQIASTIAPYRRTTYADYMHMSLEERNKMRDAFAAAAKNIADLLGIELDMSIASANIGGYQFENGGEIVEPSFTFRMNTTPEKARMFSALMADLGWEQQESVATFMSVDNPEDGNGVRFTIKFSERLLPLLEKHGIKNFTFDKQNEVLSVLSFDEADVQKLYNLTEELNNGQAEKQEVGTAPFFSTLDFEEDRRTLYEEWLQREGGQDPILDNLVKEALRRVTQQQQPVAASNNPPSAPVNTDTQVTEPKQVKQVNEELIKAMKAEGAKLSREDTNKMLELTREMSDTLSQEDIRDRVNYLASEIVAAMDKEVRQLRSDILQKLAEAQDEDEIAKLTASLISLTSPETKYREMFSQGITPIDLISDIVTRLEASQYKDNTGVASDIIKWFDPLVRSAFLVVNRRTGIEFTVDVEQTNGKSIIDATKDYDKQAAKEFRDLVSWMFTNVNIGGVAMREDDVDVDEPTSADGTSDDKLIVNARKENPYKSLSACLRMLISNINSLERDSLGNVRKLDPEFVYACLMDIMTREVNNPDDLYTMEEIQEGDPDFKRRHMFPNGKKPVFHALEKYRNVYHWMPALIKELTNDYAYKVDMQNIDRKLQELGIAPLDYEYGRTVSKLLTARREFTNFMRMNKDGSFTSVNEMPSVESIERDVVSNYGSRSRLTRTMIYNSDGSVNRENVTKLLEKAKDWSKGGSFEQKHIDSIRKAVRLVTDRTNKEWRALKDRVANYEYMDAGAKAALDKDIEEFRQKQRSLVYQEMAPDVQQWLDEDNELIDEELITGFLKTVSNMAEVLQSMGLNVSELDLLGGLEPKGKSSEIFRYGQVSVENVLKRIISKEFIDSNVGNIYAGTDTILFRAWRDLYERMHGVVFASQHATSTDEHGEARYSFLPPNEITRVWKELTHLDINRRREFIMQKYGDNPMLRVQGTVLKNPDGSWNVKGVGWRNIYLKLQWENEDNRLDTEWQADIIGNEDREFEDWTRQDIVEFQYAMFVRNQSNKNVRYNHCMYMLPIFADSPACKALGGRRYEVKDIINYMTEVAMQEYDRIHWVTRENNLHDYAVAYIAALNKGEKFIPRTQVELDMSREFNPDAEGISPEESKARLDKLKEAANHNTIANLPKNGLSFQFIPELNKQNVYVDFNGERQLINVLQYVKGTPNHSFTRSEVREVLHRAVQDVLRYKYERFYESLHIIPTDNNGKQRLNNSLLMHLFDNMQEVERDYRGNSRIYIPEGRVFFVQSNRGLRLRVSQGEFMTLSREDEEFWYKLQEDRAHQNNPEWVKNISKDDRERLEDLSPSLKKGKLLHIEKMYSKGPVSLDDVDRNLRDMWYNSTYANSQIIQILFGDIAFAKNADDFQKRWKALYAGGRQLDTNCIDGRKEYNVVILKDNKRSVSSSYSNIYKAFDSAVSEGRITKEQRDKWIESYHNIDATDAQGLRSLESFRRLLKMAGDWNGRLEQSYKRIVEGKWTDQDLQMLIQTIKPVYFGTNQQTLPGGLTVNVPMYIKNSEAVLLTIFKAIQVPYSPTLRAFDRVQKTVRYPKGHKNEGQSIIDAFQYETAVKLGGQGAVDLRYSRERLKELQRHDGWSDQTAHDSFLKWRQNKKDFKGNPDDFSTITYDELADWAHESIGSVNSSDEVGKTLRMVNGILNFLDYSREEDADKQQDWEQEMVNILTAAIYPDSNSDETNPEVVHQLDNNNLVIQQPTPHHAVDGKVSFGSQLRYLMPIDLPSNITVSCNGKNYSKEKLIEHYNRLMVARALKGYEEANSVFKDIHTLQKYLINIVKDNPRYGDDMLNALEIVEWTDENGNKHETFALPSTSINMANKLEELLTAVYRNKVHKQKMHGGSTIIMADMKFSDELKVRFDHKDRLEGVECWLPAAAKGIIAACGKYNKKTGEYTIDPKKMKEAGLDKIVGYRIPTDDKHSMLPLIVKGFLPPAMGSAIVVSKEIITMTGGDNDVDKLYLFTHHYTVEKGEMHKVEYNHDVPENENSLAQIENEIIDICHAVLTNKRVADKLFKPQDYEGIRDTSMMMQVLSDEAATEAAIAEYKTQHPNEPVDFLKMDRSILKAALETSKYQRSPIYPDTYIYYHRQNSSGKAEVGIYANNSALNAKLQDKHIKVKEDHVITVNGRRIDELSPMNSVDGNGKKTRTSDACSELLGAAADTAKDSLLADIGITKDNAPFSGFLVRMGLDLREMGLFMGIYEKHGIPKKIVNSIEKAKDKGTFITKPITTDMLVKTFQLPWGTIEDAAKEDEDILQVINALNTFSNLSLQLRSVLIGMQADSPNHALEVDFASGLYYIYQAERANRLISDPDFPFDFPRDKDGKFLQIIPNNGSDKFEDIMKSLAPVTQAYHTLGISSAIDNINRRMVSSDPAFHDWMTRLEPYLFSMKPKQAIKIIRTLYREFVTFKISKLPMFDQRLGEPGKFLENKQYFKYYFPQEFAGFVNNKEKYGVDKNFATSRIVVDDYNRLIVNEEQLSAMTKPYMFAGLDSMWQSADSGVANDPSMRMAKALVLYCFFSDGLQFGFNSISNFFSVNFLTREGHLDEYISALAELESEMEDAHKSGRSALTPMEADRYFEQFMRNNASRFNLGRFVFKDKEQSDFVEKEIKKSLKAGNGPVYKVPSQWAASLEVGQYYRGFADEYHSHVYQVQEIEGEPYIVKIADGLENEKLYHPDLTINQINSKESWYHPDEQADTWVRPKTVAQIRKEAKEAEIAEAKRKRAEREGLRSTQTAQPAQQSSVPVVPTPDNPDTPPFDIPSSADPTSDVAFDDSNFGSSDADNVSDLSGAKEISDADNVDESVIDQAPEEFKSGVQSDAGNIDGIDIQQAQEQGESKMENGNGC